MNYYIYGYRKGKKSTSLICYGRATSSCKTYSTSQSLEHTMIPMYEPLEISKCKKCGKVIAKPKELIRW